MRRGNLHTPNTDIIQGSHMMPGMTSGMAELGGLMGGNDAGVGLKQCEGVGVGSPSLTTPAKDKVDAGSKSPSSAGSKIKPSGNIVTPSAGMKMNKR